MKEILRWMVCVLAPRELASNILSARARAHAIKIHENWICLWAEKMQLTNKFHMENILKISFRLFTISSRYTFSTRSVLSATQMKMNRRARETPRQVLQIGTAYTGASTTLTELWPLRFRVHEIWFRVAHKHILEDVCISYNSYFQAQE